MVILQGAGPIPGFFESDGKIKAGLQLLWSDHKSFLEFRDRGSIVPQSNQGLAVVFRGDPIVRLYFFRPLEFDHCTCEVFLSEQDLSDLNMRRGVLRIQFSCAAILDEREGVLLLHLVHEPQTIVGLGAVGVQLERCAVFLFGLVEPVDLVECTRETDVANIGVRIFRENLSIFHDAGSWIGPEDQCCQVLSGITPAWVPAQDFAILADCGLEIAFLLIAVSKIVSS